MGGVYYQVPLALRDSLAPGVLCQWLLLYNHPAACVVLGLLVKGKRARCALAVSCIASVSTTSFAQQVVDVCIIADHCRR